jgi:hexosaminidase
LQGGIWTWNGISPNYSKTVTTTNAAHQACKRKGIGEVFATLWGDNGGETDMWSGLLGLQLYAEHGFSREIPDDGRLARRFHACTGGKAEDFLALNGLDETPGVALGNEKHSNPSKYLLFQDVLLGLFDANVKDLGAEIAAHYERLAARLANASSDSWGSLFGFYEQLSRVLAEKTNVGVMLKAAYDSKDQAALRSITEDVLPALVEGVDRLRFAHRKLWLESYKPFGWEVLDIRYGGLKSRLETAIYRLKGYLEGGIDRIEELEEERLKFDWNGFGKEMPIGWCNTSLLVLIDSQKSVVGKFKHLTSTFGFCF